MSIPGGPDKVLGTLLVGTYVNSILYTLEVIAVLRYYSISKRDSWPLRALVYFTLAVDTASTLSSYACFYFYTITNWGNVHFLEKLFWPSGVMLGTIFISEMIVQCFLIYRYWRMSNNKGITCTQTSASYWHKCIAIVLVLFVLAELGGSIAFIHLYNITPFTERNKIALPIALWLSTSAATDVAIALALFWQLSRIKSPLKRTQSLIHKLMASSIRTGTVTSVFAVLILITFLIDNESNVPSALAFCLGRVYALTMLYILNNRITNKNGPDSRTAETRDTVDFMKSLNLPTTVASEPTIGVGSIEVGPSPTSDHQGDRLSNAV